MNQMRAIRSGLQKFFLPKIPTFEALKTQRAKGLACIMAIGKTNPPNTMEQSTFPDLYFRITNTEHMVELKKKFQSICQNTAIKKRHFVWDFEMLRKNPCLLKFMEPSLNVRQQVAMVEIPKLGAVAANKAIEEWGQPKSCITHLVFSTTSGVDLPGADCHIIKLLGLNANVQRIMLYQQGCCGGGTVLRLAKCLAESCRGARVLVVCSESTIMGIRAPSEHHQDQLVMEALIGDGASAVVVGADVDEEKGEKAIFAIVSSSQVILPDSDGAIQGHVSESGYTVKLNQNLPYMIPQSLGSCLDEVFRPLNVSDWNSIFWVVHPGGRAILDRIEEQIGLSPEKLSASRHVLAEYGNMLSVTVHFILDEIRRRSIEEGKATTGQGLHWGILFAFGPGITLETIVLHSSNL